MNKQSSNVRIDKWLWSVRLYKTRTRASDACRSGEVRINDKLAKAASKITVGDTIDVKKRGFKLIFKPIKLIQKRVAAAIAVECFEDKTSAEELNKYEKWFAIKKQAEFREKGDGRPTKKDRREIDSFKTDRFYFEEE